MDESAYEIAVLGEKYDVAFNHITMPLEARHFVDRRVTLCVIRSVNGLRTYAGISILHATAVNHLWVSEKDDYAQAERVAFKRAVLDAFENGENFCDLSRKMFDKLFRMALHKQKEFSLKPAGVATLEV